MKLPNEFHFGKHQIELDDFNKESERLQICSKKNKLCTVMTFVEHKKTAHGFECHLLDFDINRIYVSTQDKRISVSFPI